MRVCSACGAGLEPGSWNCAACGFAPELDNGIPVLAPEALSAAEGFRAEAFEDLVAAEDGSFWFEGRNRLIKWAVERFFPEARSFLEVGCGTGFVLRELEASFPQIRTTGCELFTDGLRQAAGRLETTELVQADARNLPFSNEFDVVGTFDVLEHIADDRAALASIFDATVPGGGIVVTVPQHPWLWSPVDDYACHERRYTRAELRTKLEEAGFSIERMTSFVSFALPAMAFSRWRMRGHPERYQPSAEHKSAARLSGVLGGMLSAETGLIRRGASLPAGGSLLAIARR